MYSIKLLTRYMLKFYDKLLRAIQNNKEKFKGVGIVSVAVWLRYGKINSIPTYLSSNFTQQVEQTQNPVHNYIE